MLLQLRRLWLAAGRRERQNTQCYANKQQLRDRRVRVPYIAGRISLDHAVGREAAGELW